MFYKHKLDPPADVVESASFLVTLTFLRRRAAIAFVARGVARFLASEGLAATLKVAVPIELPPVGIITLRNRRRTPACEQMIGCLREAARGRGGEGQGAAPARASRR